MTVRLRVPAGLACAAAFAALPLVGAPAAAASPRPAAATADCERVVVDGAHVLGKGSAVASAAAALTSDGARVRVRTYRTVPDGDLEAFLRQQVHRCPSWHEPGGGRRADLLVLAVSVGDRRTAISYGRHWTPVLQDDETSVQTGDVDPQLAHGAYAAGIAAGLRRLHELVAGSGSDPADPADDPVLDDETDAGVPGGVDPLAEDTPPEPGFLSGGGPSVGVVAIAGAAVLVLGLARAGGRGGGRGGSDPRWTRRRAGRGAAWTGGSGFSGHSSRFSSGGSDGGSSGGTSGSGGSDGGGGSSTSW